MTATKAVQPDSHDLESALLNAATCRTDQQQRDLLVNLASLMSSGPRDLPQLEELHTRPEDEEEPSPEYTIQEQLYNAASSGNLRAVKRCLKLGADVNGFVENSRWSALHFAALKDSLTVAKLLLQAGADPNATSRTGSTPLHMAARYRSSSVALLLISKGAEVGRKDIEYGITPLHWAALKSNLLLVERLVHRGAEVDSITFGGATPLMFASRYGSIQVMEFLLDKGAHVVAEDQSGNLALHYAAEIDYPDAATLLMKRGCNGKKPNKSGRTPVKTALDGGHLNVAIAMLKRTGRSDDLAAPVFDSDVLAWLQSKDLLDPGAGSQQGSWILTIPRSDEVENAQIDESVGPQRVQLPQILRSRETYELLGFEHEKAVDLWHHYKARSPATTFIDVAIDHISRISQVTGGIRGDWSAYMDKIGIVKDLQDAISLNDFADIRVSASCDYWLETAVGSRWQMLLNINLALVRLVMTAAASGATSENMQNTVPNTGAPIQGTSAIRLPAASSTQRHVGERGGEEASLKVATDVTLREAMSTQLLWRGAVRAVLETYFDEDNNLLTQNMTSIPGDFSGQTRAAYFSHQRKVAERYAIYQWHLGTNLKLFSNPSIMGIAVSRLFLSDLDTVTLLYKDPKWREVVFKCRKKGWFSEAYGRTGVDLVKGHIASCHDEELEQITSSDQIPESMVFKIDGEYAQQWAFISEKATIGLRDDVKYAVLENILFKGGKEGEVRLSLIVRPRAGVDRALVKVRIDEIEYETRPGFIELKRSLNETHY